MFHVGWSLIHPNLKHTRLISVAYITKGKPKPWKMSQQVRDTWRNSECDKNLYTHKTSNCVTC